MDRFLYHLQTAMLAIGAGIASAFTGIIIAAIVSGLVFFGLTVYSSFNSVGMYFSNIKSLFFSTLEFFMIAGGIGAFVGLFAGAAKIISERSR